MKILQVTRSFDPTSGGVVPVAYQLSKELTKRGHDVEVITTDFKFDDAYVAPLEEYGVKVTPFPRWPNVIRSYFISPSMKGWLKTNTASFDVMHMHEFRSYQNSIAYRYAVKYAIPYILQAHGSVGRIVESQRLKLLYDWVWGYKLLADSSKVIAVSHAEENQYRKMGVPQSKITLIPNGVDVERFVKLPPRGEFREKYGIKNETIILYLGRLHRRKGIDFLIKSFSAVAKRAPDSVLVIAGPDWGYGKGARDLVRALSLEERVFFVGFVDDPRAAYVDATVVVYPGFHEIFGLVPFEALLCGTPVIVSDDCGCGEIVQSAGMGCVVKYGAVSELTDLILHVVESPEESKRMVDLAKRYIMEHLTWKTVVRQVEETYANCVRHV